MQKLLSTIFMSALALCLILQSAQASKRLLEKDETHQSQIAYVQGGCDLQHGEIKDPYWLPDELWFSILSCTFRMTKKHPQLNIMCSNGRALSTYLQVCTGWRTMIKSSILDLSPWDDLLRNECLSQWTHITSLFLSSYEVTDNGIKKLTNLTSLNLEHNSRITDDGLINLTNLTHLKLPEECFIATRNQYSPRITDKSLKNLINLRYLSFTCRPPATSLSPETLMRFTNLTKLDIYGPYNIPHQGRPGIDLPRPHLTLSSTITELTTLRSLRVEQIIVRNETIERLTNLTELQLTRNGVQITDDAIMNLTRLISLTLDSPLITTTGLEKLTNLAALYLDSADGTDISFKTLTNLWYLSIIDITDDEIKHLTGLTSLCLGRRFGNLTNVGIQRLTNLTHLELPNFPSRHWCVSVGDSERVQLSYNNDNLTFKIDNGNTMEIDRSLYCLFSADNKKSDEEDSRDSPSDSYENDDEDTDDNSIDLSEGESNRRNQDYDNLLSLVKEEDDGLWIDTSVVERYVLFTGEIPYPISWDGLRNMKKLTGKGADIREESAQAFRNDCRIRAKAYHHLAITTNDWVKKPQYLRLARENMAILAEEFPGYVNDGGQVFSTFDRNEYYLSSGTER